MLGLIIQGDLENMKLHSQIAVSIYKVAIE